MNLRITLLIVTMLFLSTAEAQDFIYGAKLTGKSNSHSMFAHCIKSDEATNTCSEFEFYVISSELPEEFYTTSTPLLKKNFKTAQINQFLAQLSRTSKDAAEAFRLLVDRKSLNQNIKITNNVFKRLALMINYRIDIYDAVDKWHQINYPSFKIIVELLPSMNLTVELYSGPSPYCSWEVKEINTTSNSSYNLGGCTHPKGSIEAEITWDFSRIKLNTANNWFCCDYRR